MNVILAEIAMKLLIDEQGKIKLWGRVLPWVLMGCVVTVSCAYAYHLVKFG